MNGAIEHAKVDASSFAPGFEHAERLRKRLVALPGHATARVPRLLIAEIGECQTPGRKRATLASPMAVVVNPGNEAPICGSHDVTFEFQIHAGTNAKPAPSDDRVELDRQLPNVVKSSIHSPMRRRGFCSATGSANE